MDAIYSLLRDNKTCGPFSLKQLASMALTPADLVWIEGSSVKWNKPFEVEALKETFISTTSNEQFNSKPGNKSEEVELVVKYSRSLEDIKSEYYLWKEKEQIKRLSYNFHFQTVPFVIILLVFLSLLIFKGAEKNTTPISRETALLQVEVHPNSMGNIK